MNNLFILFLSSSVADNDLTPVWDYATSNVKIFPDERDIVQTGILNHFGQEFSFENFDGQEVCNNGERVDEGCRVMCGMSTTFEANTRDREWRFYGCNWPKYTRNADIRYENIEWATNENTGSTGGWCNHLERDGPSLDAMHCSCPQGKAMIHFQSKRDAVKMDRQYKIGCASFVEDAGKRLDVLSDQDRWVGYGNTWEAASDQLCRVDEVMCGVKTNWDNEPVGWNHPDPNGGFGGPVMPGQDPTDSMEPIVPHDYDFSDGRWDIRYDVGLTDIHLHKDRMWGIRCCRVQLPVWAPMTDPYMASATEICESGNCPDPLRDNKFYPGEFAITQQQSHYLNEIEGEMMWKTDEPMDGFKMLVAGMVSERGGGENVHDRRFKFFLRRFETPLIPTAASRLEGKYPTNDCNGFHQTFFECSCSSGYAVYGMTSLYHPEKEDRTFQLQCAKHTHIEVTHECRWTHYVNRYEQNVNFQCEDDELVQGMMSRHDHLWKDRVFGFKCCKVKVRNQVCSRVVVEDMEWSQVPDEEGDSSDEMDSQWGVMTENMDYCGAFDGYDGIHTMEYSRHMENTEEQSWSFSKSWGQVFSQEMTKELSIEVHWEQSFSTKASGEIGGVGLEAETSMTYGANVGSSYSASTYAEANSNSEDQETKTETVTKVATFGTGAEYHAPAGAKTKVTATVHATYGNAKWSAQASCYSGDGTLLGSEKIYGEYKGVTMFDVTHQVDHTPCDDIEGVSLILGKKCAWKDLMRYGQNGGAFYKFDDLEDAVEACYLDPDCTGVFDNNCNRGHFKLCRTDPANYVSSDFASSAATDEYQSCMYKLEEKATMELGAEAVGQGGMDEIVEGAKMVENTRCQWANMLRTEGPGGGEFLQFDDLDHAVAACYLHPSCQSVFDNQCNRGGPWGEDPEWRKGPRSHTPFKLCRSSEVELSVSAISSAIYASCSFVLTDKSDFMVDVPTDTLDATCDDVEGTILHTHTKCPWEFQIRDDKDDWGPTNKDGEPEGEWIVFDNLEDAVDACYLHPHCISVFDNSCSCDHFKLCAGDALTSTIPDEDNQSCTYELTDRDLLWVEPPPKDGPGKRRLADEVRRLLKQN